MYICLHMWSCMSALPSRFQIEAGRGIEGLTENESRPVRIRDAFVHFLNHVRCRLKLPYASTALIDTDLEYEIALLARVLEGFEEGSYFLACRNRRKRSLRMDPLKEIPPPLDLRPRQIPRRCLRRHEVILRPLDPAINWRPRHHTLHQRSLVGGGVVPCLGLTFYDSAKEFDLV